MKGNLRIFVKIIYPYILGIPLLGNYPRDLNDISTKLCITIFFQMAKD
jgi:hypothetical protein